MTMKDYGSVLNEIDNPFEDDTNIDYAVSAKLLTESKEDEATWLAESITEQDSELLMAEVRAYLDAPSGEVAESLANRLIDMLCEYMRPTIRSDYTEYMQRECDALEFAYESARELFEEEQRERIYNMKQNLK